MARLAHGVRDAIVQTFAEDNASKLLRNLRRDFAAELLPELGQAANSAQFADLFAQTIAYGLFAARCNRHGNESPFHRLDAAAAMPKTNRFLRRLFETVAGPELDKEPYARFVDDLVRLLNDTDLDAVLEHFGGRLVRQDPVLQFYEMFLAEYDPRLRKTCGVYYTPEPIVSFIVRSVDDLLKTRFDIPGGVTGIAPVPSKAKAAHSLPAEKEETSPRVLILDPACGTGTFLSRVLDHIRKFFMQQANAVMWPGYVRDRLLPRLCGFELLPAPYAVAHFKLGMQLAGQDLPAGPLREQWAYDFAPDERLSIYLTNSLDEAEKRAERFLLNMNPVYSPILIVLGNPPYQGISANRGKWITQLLEDYRSVNGEPLGERKIWLKNDYIKFIRFGQWGIERTGRGILGFITDHSYLDSPTFRGMRQNLLKTFEEIYVLNLHGNAKRRERAPDGSKDENVFDIRQGVAIALFVKQGKKQRASRVWYGDLWGSRQSKYESLAASSVQEAPWNRITPAAPGFELVPVSRETQAEYHKGWPVTQIFPVAANGVQTSRDRLVVAFDEAVLLERLEAFIAAGKTEREVRRAFFGDKSAGHYPPGDTREWQLGRARDWLRRNPSWREAVARYWYRPFDERFLLYLDSMIDWPRAKVMRHLQQPNCALCVGRAGLVATGTWDLVFCVNQLCDHNLFYRGSSKNFPLYLYPDRKPRSASFAEGNRSRPNLAAGFIERLTENLKLRFVAAKSGDLKKTVGPENLLHYAYAVFHSPTYRRRYGEFLKYDFPRLPLTANVALFRALCMRGEELVRLHLMEKQGPSGATFPVKGDDTVRQVRYVEPGQAVARGRVRINDTQYFEGVAPEVWRFHIGGYRICQKWLKDRKGYRLSYDDQARYAQIVGALAETIRLMHDIDALIQEHGGWPIGCTKAQHESAE